MSDYYVQLTVQEICHSAGLSRQQLAEIVEQGILEPEGDQPEHWVFDVAMVGTARRAGRLHYDLELEWPAIALVLDLLEEKERLEQENRTLRRRLERLLAG